MKKPVAGTLEAALDTAVEAMCTGPEHLALIELCRSCSSEIDVALAFDERLWREYRLALTELMRSTEEAVEGSDLDEQLDSFLRQSATDPVAVDLPVVVGDFVEIKVESLCTVAGCDRPVSARGWCAAHYARWRRTGDVQANVPIGGSRLVG